jgi:hypothetical protein
VPYFTGMISGTRAIVLGVVANAYGLSSLVEWCPSYRLFGLSTRKPPAGPSSPA